MYMLDFGGMDEVECFIRLVANFASNPKILFLKKGAIRAKQVFFGTKDASKAIIKTVGAKLHQSSAA